MALNLNVYLTFDGNCEEAFKFYQSILGGEFLDLSPYSDMPPQKGLPPLPDDYKKRLMHVTLKVSEQIVLMGSDNAPWGPKLNNGNNFSLSLSPKTEEETKRLFTAFSKEGQVTMPLEKMFWGAYFGMCTDKFGINWMFNCVLK